jgi:MraZ protein
LVQGSFSGAMSGFAGTFGGTFDTKKGRISVPAPFRAILAKIDAEDVVLFPSRHAPCLELWPAPVYMAEVERRVAEVSPLSGEYQRIARRLLARIHTLHPDAEGRLVLPKELAESAGLDGDIQFSGIGRFVQIWAASRLVAEEARLAAEDAGGDV